MCSSCSTSILQNFNSENLVLAQIFHILLFYIILRPQCDITSHLICINQNLEKLGKQECYYNKIKAILHYFESSSKWANKIFCVICTLSVSIYLFMSCWVDGVKSLFFYLVVVCVIVKMAISLLYVIREFRITVALPLSVGYFLLLTLSRAALLFWAQCPFM